MQNYKIPRTEILKLYESSLNEISTHSIGQWLKSRTENTYIVVPTVLIHAVQNVLMQGFEAIETTKLDLKELIEKLKQWL